ncbi:MAG TPA: hypothetical protein VK155_16870 [Bacteroidales bacterium]|jgi:hypothetical protein|nr:hypothetical protein [Bacteroidales bacterium]
MRKQLETNLISLREKLAEIEKKISSQPNSRYLKEARESYLRAISSAISTLELINDLDPTVLNTVARLKKTEEVY